MKKVKAKGGYCTVDSIKPCKNNNSIKKTDWCYPCGTYTEKYIFYDFEATQNTGTHTVNLSIAQDFEGKEYIHNSIEEFCKGFLNDKFKGFTFIAHNSKGYDCHFVLKWLIAQGIKPYCIYNGAKIMFMEIPKLPIRFIDSLNFLQMPLKSFHKTFGMNELKKGYFPHYFTKECNKDYVGTIPSKKHYGYNQMKPDERTKFLKWYEERVRENYVFDFKKEILEYCRSDVDILRRGIMKLREDFIELENIDPLRYITIASVCMTIYRSNYMPNKTIAIVPEYAKTDNYSKMSIMWLNYVSTTKGLNIQHALNGGEKKLTIDDKTYKHEFNFDGDIFQTENQSLEKFKIISVQSRQNKKFKSYTNEFKVKILKEMDNVKELHYIFQELVKTVKKRRKLSNNDMLRLVIQNEELPNTISTKFNKVENFKLGDLENIINILEYRAIPIEKYKIVVQSVKIPTGKGRLYLTKDTISRKGCIITVKNDDTTCLARSIVMAMANLHSERWTKTQLHDGFNKSRKLQKEEAMKLHEEANVEINDYGNDLSDIEKFAKHLGIEINIIDAKQFNSIIYTANKGSEDKVYLLKNRNHFDVIKSLTAFYDTPYYCHECKKAYTKRDKHKCPSKCLSCFTYMKDTKCEGKEIICEKCNRKFFGKRCFKNHLKHRSKIEGKTDIVCDAVKKCLDCN